MGKIYKYLLADFFKTLILYFLILFFLISIIYFVRIAGMTSVMSLSFLDLIKIYLYYIPQIIIYTLPLTYFISLVVSLYNLSKDGEILVLFTLGFSPIKIAVVYSFVSLAISFVLVFNSLVLNPLSEQAVSNFIKIKKVESKINIASSKVGQNIGDWNIFSKEKEGNIYKDVILYANNYNGSEQFIIAPKAIFETVNNAISLTLYNGNSFSMGVDFVETSFERLRLAYVDSKEKLQHKGIIGYWQEAKSNKSRALWLCVYMLLSFFPLFSMLFAFCISVVNIRVTRRNIALWMSIVIVVYYAAVFQVAGHFPGLGGVVFGLSFFLISIVFFKKMILQRY